jgi:cytochrome c-type biogenesis protein CcmH/NrfG
MALGLLGAAPPAGDYAAAARGLESSVDPVAWGDRLAGQVWLAGGARGLSLARWALVWAGWSAVFGLAFFGWRVWCAGRAGWCGRLGVPMAVVVAGMCLWSVGTALVGWGDARRDARLFAPADLVALVPDGARVHVNPSARQAVVLFGSARGIVPVDLPGGFPADPTAWRTSLRADPVATVLLAGSVNEFRDLLGHLFESPDWRLAGMTHHGWVFSRDAGLDAPVPDVAAITLKSDTDTARCLAMLSDRLDAMHAAAAAREALKRALEIAPDDPQVLLHDARFQMARGRWNDVLSRATAALRHGADRSYALALIGRAHLESGNTAAALKALDQALRADPSNTHVLFLLARTHRDNNDFTAEAETLKRLVAAADRARLPSAGYLAYLGQARARTGDAPAAAAAYRRALESGQLADEQAQAVREALEVIETRARLGPP